MDKNKKNLNIQIIITFIIIFVLLFVFSVIFSLINIGNSNILNGISINGIDISGMSKEDAFSCISKIITNKINNNIIILSDDSETTTTFDFLEVNYDINSSINKAFNIGRSGNIFENNFEILKLIFNKKNIDLELKLNENNLKTLINEISANLPNKVIQSTYYIENNNLIITKGSNGDIVENSIFTQELYNILNNLSSLNNCINVPTKNINPDEIDIDKIYNEIHKEAQNAYYEKEPFKVYSQINGVSFDKENAKNLLKNEQNEYIIELKYTYPEITINDLNIDIFKDTLSFFTTKYDISNKDRSTNLELAASKINDTIIPPGEEFSYNKTVGARTISAGYKEAKIYSNGQVVDGIGGGICQISSTLYNSVIFANLDVTERYNHQFLTSYVSQGRDATVVYGVKDFKFKNNRSLPIKIEMNVRNGIVSCSILRNKRRKRI